MNREHLATLAALIAVAEERSFTKAAVRLGVSTSALSPSIRALEESLGARPLARTTRSVAPTEAGEQLLARAGPALGEIGRALDGIGRLRERPAGRLRIVLLCAPASSAQQMPLDQTPALDPVPAAVRGRLSGLVPGPAPAGATLLGQPAFYGSSGLFEYMDGAADAFQSHDVAAWAPSTDSFGACML
jgi:DNA-binding transcriptional LysR family regulator